MAAAPALPTKASTMNSNRRRLGATLWPNTKMSASKHTPIAKAEMRFPAAGTDTPTPPATHKP